jgi:uncharacterized membrane protein YphA (DoxX/SURF4 family)
MKEKLPIITRYILGLLFFVFGAAGLFNLIPPPADLPQDMLTFMNGMMVTKYFFPFLKLTETICGLLLLLGIAPALALIILAPITLNIVLVHLFLTPGPSNLVVPLVILVLHAISATYYWPVYAPLFMKFKR